MFVLLKNRISSRNAQSGFSLIEVLVSLSIFTIVVTISVGSLLVLIDANARARNIQDVMTNLTFALDSMTRDIRTGSHFYCDVSGDSVPDDGNTVNDCDPIGESMSFNEGGNSLTASAGSRRIAYKLGSDGTIQRRLGNNDPEWYAITSTDTTITELRFRVSGSDITSDTESPTVTIYVAGHATDDELVNGEYPSAFAVQTSVVQQLLDI